MREPSTTSLKWFSVELVADSITEDGVIEHQIRQSRLLVARGRFLLFAVLFTLIE
jgi:hypothetical protein